MLLLPVYSSIAWLSQSFVYGVERHHRPILLFLSLYACAFLLYAFALRSLEHSSWQRHDTVLMLGFALCFRALLLLSNPIQESDFYRYLWDGKVLASGLNPYGVAPAAVLAHEGDAQAYVQIAASDPTFSLILTRINHPRVPTIYPPVAQGVFALVALVAPGSLLALRLVFLGFDLGICVILLKLLRHLHLSPTWVLAYAWSPPVIKETINSAHYDVVPTFFFLLAVWRLLQNKWTSAHVSLALAILGKLYPVLLLSFFVWRTKTQGGWSKVVHGIGVLGAVLVLGYAPFLGAGSGLWQGAVTFAAEWQTNSLVFPLLLTMVPQRWLANLTVAIVLSGVVFTQIRGADSNDDSSLLKKMFIVLGVLFLLSPVADPWYFIWLAPFLCVFPSRSWILLSGLLGLYYLSFYFMYQHQAELFRWVVWAEYLPFYGLLWWDWRRGKLLLQKS
jgi:hypothetical protein